MGLYHKWSLWPSGQIYYKNKFAKKELILKGMKHYEDNSSVTFNDVSNDNSIKNFITIGDFGGPDGIAIPGRPTGEIKLNIKNISDEKKLYHTITHEISHMLGMYHMHQASIRDKFIKVNTQNIIGKKDQYDVLKGPLYVIEGDYDFESITHYSAFANGNGKNKVIEILAPNNMHHFDKMGTLDILSQTDIKTLKKMYK